MKALSFTPWLRRPGNGQGRCIPFLLCSLFFPAQAATLEFAGVLGNSGEQGASLVRFAGKPATGFGIAWDPSGSLLDRGGENAINRYAIDGRQLASYPLEKTGATKSDGITILGEDLILNINRKLFSLPLNAPAGTAPAPLPATVTQLSTHTHDGWAGAANGREIFLVNRHGEKRPVTTLGKDPSGIEIGPGNGVYVTIDGKISRIDTDAPEGGRGPWEAPGDRSQWLNGGWFGAASHGTLRRFDQEFKQDPGVVLGGASGWFIGYVEGNHEIDNGRGLAHLGGNLYAVSGDEGIVHLLEWNLLEKRFTIIRRIGAVVDCPSLAIDSKGRVWHHTGVWNWNDGPDAPVHHSVPVPANGLRGIAMTANDIMIGPGVRWGKEVLYYGDLEGPAKLADKIEALPKEAVATALIPWNKEDAIFVADPAGKGSVYSIATDGKAQGRIGGLELKSATPLRNLTSLAADSAGTLFAADAGQVVQFSREGNGWRETLRWKSWGDSADARFGESIHLALEGDHLWIADTTRHRILVFPQTGGAPIATFGTADHGGNDLGHLQSPKAIAANKGRAVFHDSGNQRLIKLEITR